MKVQIYYVKPCIEKKDALMADAEIGQKINLEKLYQKLLENGFEPNFSEDLSVLVVSLKEVEVMAFESGKISVRKAENEKVILDSVKFIAELLKN